MIQRFGSRLLLPMLLLSRSVSGQSSLLKVHVNTPEMVRNGQEFRIQTRIENTGQADVAFRIAECSYPEQWMADNPSVHIRKTFCKKNPVKEVRLKPGEGLERAFAVSLELPANREAVSFRLSFRPAGSESDAVWSDAVSVRVQP